MAESERGKPRESSDRSRHPLGVPEPRSDSSPEGPDPRRVPKQRFRHFGPKTFRPWDSPPNPKARYRASPLSKRTPRSRVALSFPREPLVSERTVSPEGETELQPFARMTRRPPGTDNPLTGCLSLSGVVPKRCPVQSRSVSQMAPSGTMPCQSYPRTGKEEHIHQPPPNASPDPNKISRPKNKIREPRKVRNSQFAPLLRCHSRVVRESGVFGSRSRRLLCLLRQSADVNPGRAGHPRFHPPGRRPDRR